MPDLTRERRLMTPWDAFVILAALVAGLWLVRAVAPADVRGTLAVIYGGLLAVNVLVAFVLRRRVDEDELTTVRVATPGTAPNLALVDDMAANPYEDGAARMARLRRSTIGASDEQVRAYEERTGWSWDGRGDAR